MAKPGAIRRYPIRYSDCSQCGLAADVPCPACGSQTIPIVYGLRPDLQIQEQRGELVLGGCHPKPTDPTRHCPGCGIGHHNGFARSPLYRHSFSTGYIEVRSGGSLAAPLAENLVRLFRSLDELDMFDGDDEVVATFSDLDRLLPRLVAGRAWWTTAPQIRAVCSEECLKAATRLSTGIQLSAFSLDAAEDWSRVFGPGPQNLKPTVVHVSSAIDPVGMLALHWDDRPVVITRGDDLRPNDERLLAWALESRNRKPRARAAGADRIAVLQNTYHCRLSLDIDDRKYHLCDIEYSNSESEDPGAECSLTIDGGMAAFLTGAPHHLRQDVARPLTEYTRAWLGIHARAKITTESWTELVVESVLALQRQIREDFFDKSPAQGQGFVYGWTPWGPVFMKRTDGETWASAWTAIQEADTLGPLRAKLSGGALSWLEGVLEFNEGMRTDDNDVVRPADDDLDVSSLACQLSDLESPWPWFANDDYQLAVIESFPAEISTIVEYQISPTMLDGLLLEIENADEVAAALDATGIHCPRDDSLVNRAFGPLAS